MPGRQVIRFTLKVSNSIENLGSTRNDKFAVRVQQQILIHTQKLKGAKSKMKRTSVFFYLILTVILTSLMSCETEEKTMTDIAGLGSTLYGGSQFSVPELVEWLYDDNWKYRREAAYSLGKLGETFQGSELIIGEAIPALLERLKNDEDTRVRLQAAKALGKTKHLSAKDGFIRSLEDTNENIMIRSASAEALLGIVGTEEAVIGIPVMSEALLHWKGKQWPFPWDPRAQVAGTLQRMITDGGIKIKSYESSIVDDGHADHQHDGDQKNPVPGTVTISIDDANTLADGRKVTFRLPWKTYYLTGETSITKLNEIDLQVNKLNVGEGMFEVTTAFDLNDATIVAVDGKSLAKLRDTEHQKAINEAFKNYMEKYPDDFGEHHH